MNKRYIDFVPAKKASGKPNGQAVRVKVAQPRAAMVTRTTVTKTVVAGAVAESAPVKPVAREVAPRRVAQSVPQMTEPAIHKMPTEKKPVLGVVEDLNSHFVETNVPKRPLSEKPVVRAKATEAKQQKVKARVLRPAAKPKAKPVAKPTPVKPVEKPVENSTYKPPKSPFINQNKVVKRPLSGNIYKKQITEAVKEEPKGPVTIIAKPEKDRHIGIIVTIIITIILGAAAGTVAFLLLPK